MADHLSEQIFRRVLAILAPPGGPYPTDCGANVFRNRSNVIPEGTQYPVINMLLGKDAPMEGRSGYANLNFVDSEMEIFIDISVSTVAQDVDTKLIQVRKQIHLALVANGVTNLSMPANVFVIFPGDAEEPVIQTGSAKQIATMRVIWKVRYRTRLADPTQ